MTSPWLAASVAVAGALPVSPAAAHALSPSAPTAAAAEPSSGDLAADLSSGGPHCGYLERTGETRCFPTFADELRWVGFTDVPDGYGLEQYLAEHQPGTASALTAGDGAGTGAILPSGQILYALRDNDGSDRMWTHWGSSWSCAAANFSLEQVADGWNNDADAVINGLCGTVKLFDAWSGSACNTATRLTTVTGNWDDETWLSSSHQDRTSCIVMGA